MERHPTEEIQKKHTNKKPDKRTILKGRANMFNELKRKIKLLMGEMPLQNGAIDANYEEYWEKRINSDELIKKRTKRIHKRMNTIAELIKDNSTVLDIGCGNGDLLSLIHRKKPNCKLSGLDISSDAIKKTQERGFIANKVDITTTEILAIGKYDYIIMSELIEHLANPEKVILELKEIVNNNIIITTPNIAFILFRMRLFFFGKFPVTTVFHIREHLSFWSVKDFNCWSKSLGFCIEKTVSFGGIEFLKLNKFMPNLFANHMLYVIKTNNT